MSVFIFLSFHSSSFIYWNGDLCLLFISVAFVDRLKLSLSSSHFILLCLFVEGTISILIPYHPFSLLCWSGSLYLYWYLILFRRSVEMTIFIILSFIHSSFIIVYLLSFLLFSLYLLFQGHVSTVDSTRLNAPIVYCLFMNHWDALFLGLRVTIQNSRKIHPCLSDRCELMTFCFEHFYICRGQKTICIWFVKDAVNIWTRHTFTFFFLSFFEVIRVKGRLVIYAVYYFIHKTLSYFILICCDIFFPSYTLSHFLSLV